MAAHARQPVRGAGPHLRSRHTRRRRRRRPRRQPDPPRRSDRHLACEGFLIGDGAHTETGPRVVSTQVFEVGEFDGLDTVVSHGVEIPDIGQEVQRAVIGGTGEHAGAVGTQRHVLEAFNDSEGVNLSIVPEPAAG